MRRETFAQVGGYRRVFPYAEDYDLFLRMSERLDCANLKQVVVQYRIHPHQLSLRTRRQQTIAKLAAQAAASARRTRDVDPLDSVEEISQSLLLETKAREQQVPITEATYKSAQAADERAL